VFMSNDSLSAGSFGRCSPIQMTILTCLISGSEQAIYQLVRFLDVCYISFWYGKMIFILHVSQLEEEVDRICR
jgi:hypothetical protein